MVSTEGVKVQAQGICIFILQTTDSNCGNGLEGCSFVNFSGVRSSLDLINSAASAPPAPLDRAGGWALGACVRATVPPPGPREAEPPLGPSTCFWGDKHIRGGGEGRCHDARGISSTWNHRALVSLYLADVTQHDVLPVRPRWTVGPLGASTFLLCKMGRSQRWNKDRVASRGHGV